MKTQIVILLFVVVGSVLCDSICARPQCRCISKTQGTDIICDCLNKDEKILLKTEDLPENALNLTIKNCGSVGVTNTLSSLHLRTITFKGIKDLKIPSQSFLTGLRQLSSVVFENVTLPLLPSFSFSSLSKVFEIQFKNANIGAISTDTFSGLSDLKNLKFIASKIKSFERHAFGRGTSKITNLILDGSDVETIRERAIWLSDADILHIDKCNINKIEIDAIKLDNAYFIYLTRSSIQNYEAGGISGHFFSGVMIDNDYINPSTADNTPRPLFSLEESRTRGSSVVPFFHFTNNVLTKLLLNHAFFIANPTINVAVPNNTLWECSCPDYRSFLQSLGTVLDDYTLNIHQALVENGICLLDGKIFSIGCPDLMRSFDSRPKITPIPSRALPQRTKVNAKDDTSTSDTNLNGKSKSVLGNTPENTITAPKFQQKNETKIPSTTPSTAEITQTTTRPPLRTTTKSTPRVTLASLTQTHSLPIDSVGGKSNDSTTNKQLTSTNQTIPDGATTSKPDNLSISIGDPVIRPNPTISTDNSQQSLPSGKQDSLITARINVPRIFQQESLQSSGKSQSTRQQESLQSSGRSQSTRQQESLQSSGKNQSTRQQESLQSSKKSQTADQADTESVWNEIFGGIFAQRLRKPLPVSFPTAQPSIKFRSVVKQLGLIKFQRGNIVNVSPR